MACCDIFTVFDEKNNLIKEYTHWKLLIRNRSTTLGNCVAITKTHHEQFSGLSAEEMKDFSNVVKDIEKALSICFHYDKINYLMLMLKDNHTHFHILPRYATPKIFENVTWEDKAWPSASELISMKGPIVDQDYLDKVKKEIIKQI